MRKRKEIKYIYIYVNNKPLEQVTTMKYLGIIIDDKFKFSHHISYAAEKCTTLIYSLPKSAKISRGLKHEAFKTIYRRDTNSFTIWSTSLDRSNEVYAQNRLKYIRVQRLINIRMAKAFRTSSEALCIVTGTTPIIMKNGVAVKQYNIIKWKGSQTLLIDREVELKNWPHPEDVVKIIEGNGCRYKTIQKYTDGSKNDHGVGSGLAIFVGKEFNLLVTRCTTILTFSNWTF
jgi:hypothetical protein